MSLGRNIWHLARKDIDRNICRVVRKEKRAIALKNSDGVSRLYFPAVLDIALVV